MSLIIIKQFIMYQKHAKEQLHKIIFSTLDDTIKKRTHYPMNSLFTQIRCRQLAIFPGSGPPSIFASMSLFDRVRDGNGSFPHDLSPTNLSLLSLSRLATQSVR